VATLKEEDSTSSGSLMYFAMVGNGEEPVLGKMIGGRCRSLAREGARQKKETKEVKESDWG